MMLDGFFVRNFEEEKGRKENHVNNASIHQASTAISV